MLYCPEQRDVVVIIKVFDMNAYSLINEKWREWSIFFPEQLSHTSGTSQALTQLVP